MPEFVETLVTVGVENVGTSPLPGNKLTVPVGVTSTMSAVALAGAEQSMLQTQKIGFMPLALTAVASPR